LLLVSLEEVQLLLLVLEVLLLLLVLVHLNQYQLL